MNTAVTPVTESPFVHVPVEPKQNDTGLDPRAARYGMCPIWKVSSHPWVYGTWEIPANKVYPFIPTPGEHIEDTKGAIVSKVERLPNDKILDLQREAPFFVEYPLLAKLSEAQAGQIVSALANPADCSKYPFELGKTCSTCHLEFLRANAPTIIRDTFGTEGPMYEAAKEYTVLTIAAYDKAINEARRLVDVSIRAVDDPKNGKDQFYDWDYNNIYHIHGERPKFKTSTAATNDIEILAAAIRNGQTQAPASTVDVEAIVAAAVEKATAPLLKQLAQSASTPVATESVVTDDDLTFNPEESVKVACSATNSKGNPCKNKATDGEFCDSHQN